MLISSILKNWYLQNKRELPWRQTNNPYFIWISEVILQQTRVNQGLSYYANFINQFPDIETLASSTLEQVYKVWQGLGYYSRAKNLHEGAKFIHQNYHGKLPEDFKQLLTIKGIGEYTAAAIASIAFHKNHIAIDGNVHRVISRLYGVTDAVDSAKGRNKIKLLAEELIQQEDPGEFNQALMEFGALQCVPKNPDCSICPLASYCYALQHNLTGVLPVKTNKIKSKTRYFYYLFIQYNTRYLFIKQRNAKDIWQGLYEFPLLETNKKYEMQDLMQLDAWKNLFKNIPLNIIGEKKHFKHQLTHQTIEADFIHVRINAIGLELTNNYLMIEGDDFATYPVSRLIDKYIHSIDF
jgi:A/G-specific adenine glycosylase